MRKESLARLEQHGVATIPAGWRQSRVKYLGSYMNGYPFKPSDWGTEGRPILRIQDLSGSNAEPNRFEGEINPRHLIRRGDILISWSASLGVYRWAGEDAWLNQHIFKVAVDRTRLREDFFVWLAEWFIAEMDREVHGSTMQHLTADAFGGFPVLLPPAPQQRAIADYLDRETARIDALIAAKERVLGLLAEKRRALINRAVTRGLDPRAPLRDSGIPWLGEIPAHWKLVPFRWYFRIGSGDFIATDDVASAPEGERSTPVIGGNGLAGFGASRNTEGTSIVIGRVGALCGNVHLVDGPAWVTDNALLIQGIRAFDACYLSYVLRERDLNSIANKTAQPLITGGMVSDLRGPLPPMEEQRSIVKHIARETARLDDVSAATERTIALLKERRSALIAAAVTGQIDVEAAA